MKHAEGDPTRPRDPIRFKPARPVAAAVLIVAATLALAGGLRADDRADGVEASERRLAAAVRYLAADELEGRGVGTRGLDLAADFVAREFAPLGLKTDLFDGTPFQTFKMTTGAELGEKNHLVLVGPPAGRAAEGRRIEWKLGEDFNPLAIGGSGMLDLPLVFVGYGITAKDEGYDDYAGVDVEGKAVIVLRHEPQQFNPHSAFNGTQHSAHAPLVRKLSNAYEHGAVAVVFSTDEFDIREKAAPRRKRWEESIVELSAAKAAFSQLAEPTPDQIEAHRQDVEKRLDDIRQQGQQLEAERDPVLDFRAGGPGGDAAHLPVVHCRRSVLDEVLRAALGVDLASLERQIDQGPTPDSRELAGWRLTGEVTVHRREAEVKNVIAVLEGEGPLADETIVVGAHYDHLGFGGEGSLEPDKNEVHNGADDNASGTAALIEVARLLAARPKKLPRRVVFVAFTGEERGLFGSARYCRQPPFPLDRTIAMLNMDMVGRLADDKLVIQGVDTATEFGPLIDQLAQQFGFKVTRQPGGFGPSDHLSFYAQKVPVMHFFTGTHGDYHRPSDDYDKVNVGGMRRVAELVAEAAARLADAESRPQYLETKRPALAGGGGDRPYFGSIPDFGEDEPGYAISGVAQDGPAEKGGLKGGDIIVRFGQSKIGGLEDFDSALRKYKAGDKVQVVVKRGGEEVTLEVVLEPPR